MPSNAKQSNAKQCAQCNAMPSTAATPTIDKQCLAVLSNAMQSRTKQCQQTNSNAKQRKAKQSIAKQSG